jgi:hypothetical protein
MPTDTGFVTITLSQDEAMSAWLALRHTLKTSYPPEKEATLRSAQKEIQRVLIAAARSRGAESEATE